MTKANYTKAEWVANQMEGVSSVDDVLDVLLGNITKPRDFVDDVEALAREYDEAYEKGRQNVRR